MATEPRVITELSGPDGAANSAPRNETHFYEFGRQTVATTAGAPVKHQQKHRYDARRNLR